jgi:hypothetical protein
MTKSLAMPQKMLGRGKGERGEGGEDDRPAADDP